MEEQKRQLEERISRLRAEADALERGLTETPVPGPPPVIAAPNAFRVGIDDGPPGQGPQGAPVAEAPLPPKVPRSRVQAERLEYELGAKLLPRLGAVAIIAGLAFLVSTGLNRQVISREAVFWLVCMADLILVGLGLFKRHEREDFGQVLVGIGVCAQFVNLGAGHAYAGMYDAAALIASFLVLAAASFAYAAWRSSPSFVAIGLVGGLVGALLPCREGTLNLAAVLCALVLVPAGVLIARHRWGTSAGLFALPVWFAACWVGLSFPSTLASNYLLRDAVFVGAAILTMATAAWAGPSSISLRRAVMGGSLYLAVFLISLVLHGMMWSTALATVGVRAPDYRVGHVFSLVAAVALVGLAKHPNLEPRLRAGLRGDAALVAIVLVPLLLPSSHLLIGYALEMLALVALPQLLWRADDARRDLLGKFAYVPLAISVPITLDLWWPEGAAKPGPALSEGPWQIAVLMLVAALALLPYTAPKDSPARTSRTIFAVLFAFPFVGALGVVAAPMLAPRVAYVAGIAAAAMATGVVGWRRQDRHLVGASLALAFVNAPYYLDRSGGELAFASAVCLSAALVASFAVGRLFHAGWGAAVGAANVLVLGFHLARGITRSDLPENPATTSIWIGGGALFLIVGFLAGDRPLRFAGMGLLGAALLKFIVVDLTFVDVLVRGLLLLVLGVTMLVGGYAYVRLRTGAPGSGEEAQPA